MFHARTLPTSRLCGINACLWRRQVHRVALPGASWEDAECYTSDRADVLRLRSFLSLGRFEFDLLVLIQRPVARARDRGEVDEHVGRPVIGGDETKALIGVEPLHCACCHQFKSSVRHATTRSAAPTASLPVLAVEPGPAPVVVFRTSGGRGEDSGHEPCKAAG